MKKIPSLFKRNYETDRLVRDEITEGCEWVQEGKGYATRKFDGTCCLVRDGQLYRRFEVKKGKKPPEGFEPASNVDPNTGKQQGWVRVSENNPSDKWHVEAFQSDLSDGTYELCGPKVQGNPEGFDNHVLIPHGNELLNNCPRDFEGIKNYLKDLKIEGIVWHNPNGQMVKIKKKDFFKK